MALQYPLYSVGVQSKLMSGKSSTRSVSGINLPSDLTTNSAAVAADLLTFANLLVAMTTGTRTAVTLTTKQGVE